LFRRITRLGWHPFLRINTGGTFRPHGHVRRGPLKTFVAAHRTAVPGASPSCWYGLRAWIEQGFKITKRAGWQWQRTHMTKPERAARLWLAVAVATLWLLSVGGEADETIPATTVPGGTA